MAATHETGYTIETRLKILESTGTSGALYLNGSLPDGKYNGFLYFYPNQLKWGSTTIVPSIDTAEWHTYRVVRLQNEDRYHVYVDGELVNGNLLNAYNGRGPSTRSTAYTRKVIDIYEHLQIEHNRERSYAS